MKRTLMFFSAFVLTFTCFLRIFNQESATEVFSPRGTTVELPIIMYHSLVTGENTAAQYVCPISRVESDLCWLREHGFESVTLAQLIAFADGTGTLPAKPVLITLDDGYRNNLTLLPPLLERYDAHAVISVVGEYSDIYTASGEDGSPHTCMSWEDLSLAAASPRLELANHSYYFHHLTPRKGSSRKANESVEHWKDAFCTDVQAMQAAMQENCGLSPRCYAYPFGQLTTGADALLQEMGFRVTLTCNEEKNVLTSGKSDCLFSLGRYNRDGRISTEKFMAELFEKS